MWDGCTVANGWLPVVVCGGLGERVVETLRAWSEWHGQSGRVGIGRVGQFQTGLGCTFQLGWGR
jgi:hypothetical protein